MTMKKKLHLLTSLCLVFLIQSTRLTGQCTFTSTAPYIENFSGVTALNQLPTCWVATNLGTACGTLPAPFSCAAISSSLTGTHYFYTHGFQLYAGVTYSVSAWYKLNLAISNYSNFALALSSTQSSVSLTSLAMTSGSISNTAYAPLSGTFTVPGSAIYYFAISAMVTGTAPSQQGLLIDDFTLSMPCQLPNNSPQLTVTPSSANLCQGSSLTVSVTGANSYTWSNGSNAAVQTLTALVSNTLTVSGTSTLTGCSASSSLSIGLLPSPVISAFANPGTACLGSTVTLQAAGALSYQWSNGASGAAVTATVSNLSLFTVIGTGANSCTASATSSVSVNALPILSVLMANDTVCAGQVITLTGQGATTYTWMNNGTPVVGSAISVTAALGQTYSISGTDNNGCSNTTSVGLVIELCNALNEQSVLLFKLYPNPAKDFLNLQMTQDGYMQITDMMGRQVMGKVIHKGEQKIDLSHLSDGLYYLQFENGTLSQGRKLLISR